MISAWASPFNYNSNFLWFVNAIWLGIYMNVFFVILSQQKHQ